MRRFLLVGFAASAMLVLGASAVLAHGGELDVVVEAKASDPLDILHTDYAITLNFADGDVVEDAVVSARASDGTKTVLPVQAGSQGNLYTLHFVFPQPGQWTLSLAVDHPDVQLELTLVEAIPIGDPGTHLVRLDTVDESRIGSVGRLVIADHPLTEPPSRTTTTTSVAAPSPSTTLAPAPPVASTSTLPASPVEEAAPTGPTSPATSHVAVLQVKASGVMSLPVELVARWAHLGMITLWGLAVLAMAVRLESRFLSSASLAGLVGTLVTGLLLGLWGTPVGYPGIFRWSDLGALDYGAAWQSSFLLKMAGVVAAVIGTAAAVKRKGWGARFGVAGMGFALIAVTALSQFHLLTHS